MFHTLALVAATVLVYGALMLWVRANRVTLLNEEWQRRNDRHESDVVPLLAPATPRDLPLTPVQQHYLEVMGVPEHP